MVISSSRKVGHEKVSCGRIKFYSNNHIKKNQFSSFFNFNFFPESLIFNKLDFSSCDLKDSITIGLSGKLGFIGEKLLFFCIVCFCIQY